MLYQVHHQNKADRSITEMVLQIDKEDYNKDTINVVQKSHPLPEGWDWLICNEESEHFLWAVDESVGNGTTQVPGRDF